MREQPYWTYTKDMTVNAEYIALSNRIGRGVCAKTKKLREGLLVDLNENGEIIGIEILFPRKASRSKSLLNKRQ